MCLYKRSKLVLTDVPVQLQICTVVPSYVKPSTHNAWRDLRPTGTTILRPLLQDHLVEPVPEENFWTLWCKGRLTEADTPTIRLGATPSGLTSAHLHHPPFFMGQMPFRPANQQCQSTEGNLRPTGKLAISRIFSRSLLKFNHLFYDP